MGNQFFVLARKQVDDRYFYHRVATGLLFHRGTGHANQYLSRQRRIVDMHVELEQLVLGFSGYAFACQVDAVSHVQQLVYTRYFYDVGFIVDEIGIGFDGCGYFRKLVSFLYLYIYHAAVNTRTGGDGHGERGFHSFHGFYGYGMSHAHARSEIRVGDAFGGIGL